MIHKKIQNALTGGINPRIFNNGKNKLAAVLIIIYGDKPEILMTKKPITLMHHGGEISFPGGKISDIDDDLLDTALRETKEETGLGILRDDVVGQLKQVITLNSGFTTFTFGVFISNKLALDSFFETSVQDNNVKDNMHINSFVFIISEF